MVGTLEDFVEYIRKIKLLPDGIDKLASILLYENVFSYYFLKFMFKSSENKIHNKVVYQSSQPSYSSYNKLFYFFLIIIESRKFIHKELILSSLHDLLLTFIFLLSRLVFKIQKFFQIYNVQIHVIIVNNL